MFEQTERHIFFLVLGFQRIRRLSYHATQGFNLLLVSIMVDVPSSLRMLKGPSAGVPVYLLGTRRFQPMIDGIRGSVGAAEASCTVT